MKEREKKQEKEQEKFDIFISYRRINGVDLAKHLRDILVEKGYSVFFDLDSLRSGDFDVKLLDVIKNCTDYIIILSPNALDRCVNEGDWVRRELACALENGKNIVPIMGRDFHFPDELPKDINGIRYKHGIDANTRYFQAMLDDVFKFLHSKPKKRANPNLLLTAAAVLAALALCAAVALAAVFLLRSGQNANQNAALPVPTQEPGVQIAQSPNTDVPIITESPAFTEAPVITDAPDPTVTPNPAENPTLQPAAAWQGGNILMPDGEDIQNVYSADALPVFGSEITRGEIASVSVLSTTAGAPETAWDVSRNENRSVLAWVEKNGELYDLYIAGEGGVTAPKNCRGLFCGYSKAEAISFGDAFHTDPTTSMDTMFGNMYCLKKLDLSGFCTSSVKEMDFMFLGCSKLEELDISSFDTSNVETMSWMFLACSSLEELNLSSFDTSRVGYMSRMFNGCKNLRELDISAFDTSGVKMMESMFQGCAKLKTLRLGRFDTSSLTSREMMFNGCDILGQVFYGGTEADWQASGLAEELDPAVTVHFASK